MTSLSGTVSATSSNPPGSGEKPFPVAEIEQETEGEIEVQKNEWRVHCRETRDGESEGKRASCSNASMKRLAEILCDVSPPLFVFNSSVIFAI